MTVGYVVVVAEDDPVARAVASGWPGGPRLDGLEGSGPVRALAPGVGLLRRPGPHIFDADLRVAAADGARPTLVFPSVHRSATSRATLTVHPLGNPSPSAELGGRPGELVPTDPRRMTDALRRMAELAGSLGWPVSFEATHHGPAIDQPAFFVEIGAEQYDRPPDAAVRGLRELLPELVSDPSDRVAVGVGGGHYAPHFTDLALERHWAFGHLIPRHAVGPAGPGIAAEALRRTPGAEGIVYHRARDAEELASGAGPRLRDADAPPRRNVG